MQKNRRPSPGDTDVQNFWTSDAQVAFRVSVAVFSRASREPLGRSCAIAAVTKRTGAAAYDRNVFMRMFISSVSDDRSAHHVGIAHAIMSLTWIKRVTARDGGTRLDAHFCKCDTPDSALATRGRSPLGQILSGCGCRRAAAAPPTPRQPRRCVVRPVAQPANPSPRRKLHASGPQFVLLRNR